MGQVDRIYRKYFRKNFNREPNFPPSSDLNLGDYGIIEAGNFKTLGNIKADFGIDYTIGTDKVSSHESFNSDSSVKINVGANGDIGSKGRHLLDSQIEIVFNSEKSMCFIADRVRHNKITNVNLIGKEIIKLYEKDQWNKDHLIITYLMEAGATKIFVSNSKDTNVILESKTGNSIGLTDVDANVKIHTSSSSVYKNETLQSHLGYSVSKIKDDFLSKPILKGIINIDSNDILYELAPGELDHEEIDAT